MRTCASKLRNIQHTTSNCACSLENGCVQADVQHNNRLRAGGRLKGLVDVVGVSCCYDRSALDLGPASKRKENICSTNTGLDGLKAFFTI